MDCLDSSCKRVLYIKYLLKRISSNSWPLGAVHLGGTGAILSVSVYQMGPTKFTAGVRLERRYPGVRGAFPGVEGSQEALYLGRIVFWSGRLLGALSHSKRPLRGG